MGYGTDKHRYPRLNHGQLALRKRKIEIVRDPAGSPCLGNGDRLLRRLFRFPRNLQT